MKNYRQEGNVMDWVNGTGSLVHSGDVVVFPFGIGIAAVDIPNGQTGSVQVEEVFRLPKATGAIAQGATVYWDNTAKKITTTASGNTMAGHAFVAALSGDATVDVKIVPQPA